MNFKRHWRAWLVLIIVIGGVLWLGEWAYNKWADWNEDDFDREIVAAAKRYGVEPALIKAVVWRESKFNPNVRGSKGEVGLMQIMKPTAMEWAGTERIHFFQHEDLFDPGKNTQCGAWVLRRALLRYQRKVDNPLPFALAEYNAGGGNAKKWMTGAGLTNSAAFTAQIGFPGTKHYVITAIQRYEKYRRQFAQKD